MDKSFIDMFSLAIGMFLGFILAIIIYSYGHSFTDKELIKEGHAQYNSITGQVELIKIKEKENE